GLRRRARRELHGLRAHLLGAPRRVSRRAHAHGRQGRDRQASEVGRRRGRGGSELKRVDLPLIFTMLMGASVLAYVVLDGFEHGFGYWLFAIAVGGSLCGGYVLLGATWLVLKTEGALQKKALAWARWGLAWVALGVALVSLATPLVSETVRHKWFDFPRTLWLMALPAASVACGAWLWAATGRLRR